MNGRQKMDFTTGFVIYIQIGLNKMHKKQRRASDHNGDVFRFWELSSYVLYTYRLTSDLCSLSWLTPIMACLQVGTVLWRIVQ